MARFDTAQQIINAAANECGLAAASGFDPTTSADPAFVQLTALCTSAGRELYGMHEWQMLNKTFTQVTHSVDSGLYNLPADFGYIIDGTGWDPTQLLPLGGPLTPQNWEYLVNTGLSKNTVYVSFKLNQGQFQVLPVPPPEGHTLKFEYVSRYWVAVTGAPTTPAQDQVLVATDVILFEPILMVKFLKLRFLEAKGFDTTAATNQFISMFNSFTGKDESAQTLNMSRMRVFPYLGWRNIPETNYGLP
jgi:hypothetical protein